jgi:hypothetical protein
MERQPAKRRPEERTRDRAILIVRLATIGGLAGALGFTWLFSNLAEAFFSGKAPAVPAPPSVPVAAVPVQQPRAVVTTVVHHKVAVSSGGSVSTGRSSAPAPRPPSQGPAPAPPPPPPPACHGTPSHPC